jgi:hypothetical protein
LLCSTTYNLGDAAVLVGLFFGTLFTFSWMPQDCKKFNIRASRGRVQCAHFCSHVMSHVEYLQLAGSRQNAEATCECKCAIVPYRDTRKFSLRHAMSTSVAGRGTFSGWDDQSNGCRFAQVYHHANGGYHHTPATKPEVPTRDRAVVITINATAAAVADGGGAPDGPSTAPTPLSAKLEVG